MADGSRIALVGPAHPYRGGIAHFTEHLAAGLEGRGHATRVITFTRQYPERLFPGRTQFSEAPAPDAPPERLLDSLSPRSWRRTARNISSWKADAAVFSYWTPFLSPAFGRVARLLKRRKTPTIVIVHNAVPHERRPGDLTLARYFLRAASGLIVLSDAVKADLDRKIGVKAPIRQTVHPLYDNFGDAIPKAEARRRLGIPDDRRLVLFFGFVRPYKGLRVLLEAMPRVVGRVPNAMLLVAGECYGDDFAYRSDIAAMPEESIRWDERYVPDEDVSAYFCAADVVAQPYVSATQSGVAQIAFQFGRPMIVTDVGGLPEAVRHGELGLVVPRNDPSALADAIVGYFRNELEGRLSKRVLAERAKYGWDPLYDAVEAFLPGH